MPQYRRCTINKQEKQKGWKNDPRGTRNEGTVILDFVTYNLTYSSKTLKRIVWSNRWKSHREISINNINLSLLLKSVHNIIILIIWDHVTRNRWSVGRQPCWSLTKMWIKPVVYTLKNKRLEQFNDLGKVIAIY